MTWWVFFARDTMLYRRCTKPRPARRRRKDEGILQEHLEAGRAIDTGTLIQRLRKGIEEALGDVVSHTGACRIDEDKSGDGVLTGKADEL